MKQVLYRKLERNVFILEVLSVLHVFSGNSNDNGYNALKICWILYQVIHNFI